MTTERNILVVVLSHNDVEDTRACMEQLLPLASEGYRLVVCDNGSESVVRDELAQAFRDGVVTLLRHDRNLGFAAGVMAVLGTVGTDWRYVLLVNNDAIVSAETVRRMVEEASETGATVASPVVVYRDRPDVVWQAGGVVWSRVLHVRMPFMGLPVAQVPAETRDVDFVSGCVMLIAGDWVRRSPLFDPEYFYSVEDLDLCLRVKRAGSRVVLLGGLRAAHGVARTSGGWHGPFAVYHALRGRAYLITRHLTGYRRVLALAFLWSVVLPAKAAQMVRSNRAHVRKLPTLPKAIQDGLRAGANKRT